MRVVRSVLALDQLAAIEGYICRSGSPSGHKGATAHRARVGELGSGAHIGRPGRVEDTRELVITGTPYIVAYYVRDDRVEIAAVLHGAQRWPEQF